MVTVGLDLGTSSLKGVVLDSEGRVLARCRHGYPTHRPEPGAAEQEPGDWWKALDVVVTDLAAQVDPVGWVGIGLSGMLPTLVALDAVGQPVGRALTWQDARADAEGERFRRDAGEGHYTRTGQWVDGRYLVPMMERLVRVSPTVEAAGGLCGAKDALFARLTGDLLTDPSTATGAGCFDLTTGDWDPVTTPPQWTLPAVAPTRTARPLRGELARKWGLPAALPVVLGAADSVLGAYALWAGSGGDVAYLAGSSTVVLGRLPGLEVDPAHRYLVTPLVDSGFGAEMDLLATGSASAWLAGLLGLDGPGELGRLAATTPAWETPVLLPYLAPGEQGALWDPSLTGAITGLSLRTTPAQLARALQTGIVLESARCIGVLRDTSGADAPVVDLAGAALTESFAQDLADVTGCPVRLHADEPDQSAVGAALLAAAALGLHLDRPLTEAVDSTPDPGAARQWQRLWARHEAARAALAAGQETR